MSEKVIPQINPEHKVTFYLCGKQLANNIPENGSIKDVENKLGKILRQEKNRASAMYASMQNMR